MIGSGICVHTIAQCHIESRDEFLLSSVCAFLSFCRLQIFSQAPSALPPSPSFPSTTDAAGCSTPTSSPLRCRHFPIATYRLLLWYPACLSRHLRCWNRYISRGSSHFYPFWSYSPSLNIVQSKHQKPLTQLFRIFSLNYLTQEGSFVLSL